MKIEIEDDVFEIVKRLKEIDDGYFVLYDTCKNRFEVHNYYQENTYCLMCPFDVLDDRLIDVVLYSNVLNIDKIIEDIDNINDVNESNGNIKLKNQQRYMFEEIFKFANNSSKKIDGNLAFKNIWR